MTSNLLNFTKYNYIIWCAQIKKWVTDDNLKFDKAIDIACGDGEFLRELINSGVINKGIGLDINPPKNNHKGNILYYKVDLLKDIIEDDNLKQCGAAFFMNTFYVLPDLLRVKNILIKYNDIFISIPTKEALEIYEKKHPGKNFLDREINEFIDSIEGFIYKKSNLVSNYYLKNPFIVLLGGGINRYLAYQIEGLFSHRHFYELLWIKKLPQ